MVEECYISAAVTTDSDPYVPLSIPSHYGEPHWFAVYTRARHEKRVTEQLRQQETFAVFLPTYKTVRRWKDRRKLVELPLFPGYVFVRIALKDRLNLLRIPGVVRLVGFNGIPTPLPEREIDSLREALRQRAVAKPHPFLAVGRKVRVKNGPLAGLEGTLLRHKGRYRLVVSLELIQRSTAVDIDAADLESLPNGVSHAME